MQYDETVVIPDSPRGKFLDAAPSALPVSCRNEKSRKLEKSTTAKRSPTGAHHRQGCYHTDYPNTFLGILYSIIFYSINYNINDNMYYIIYYMIDDIIDCIIYICFRALLLLVIILRNLTLGFFQ